MGNPQYLIWYRGSHNVIEWQLMKNSVTDELVTGATVEVTVKDDATGEPLAGETWPLAMAEVEDGKYRATASNAVVVTDDQELTAFVDATGPGGEVGHKEVPVVVKVSNI